MAAPAFALGVAAGGVKKVAAKHLPVCTEIEEFHNALTDFLDEGEMEPDELWRAYSMQGVRENLLNPCMYSEMKKSDQNEQYRYVYAHAHTHIQSNNTYTYNTQFALE